MTDDREKCPTCGGPCEKATSFTSDGGQGEIEYASYRSTAQRDLDEQKRRADDHFASVLAGVRADAQERHEEIAAAHASALKTVRAQEQEIESIEQQLEDERMRHHVHAEAERKAAVERGERIAELAKQADAYKKLWLREREEWRDAAHADTDPVLRAAIDMPAPDAMMDKRSIMDYWKRLQKAIAASKRCEELKGESNENE